MINKDIEAKLIQIFESKDGEIFRFSIAFGCGNAIDLSKLQVLKGGVALADAKAVSIGCDACNHPLTQSSSGVISIDLAKGAPPFDVVYDGRKIAAVTEGMHDRMVFERDMRMVNPGIDGLYTQWLERSRLHMRGSEALLGLGHMPLMSIVVPLFNTPPDFLHDLLKSVVSQIYTNWELILVNASPENAAMRAVLQEYEDERITVLELDGNLGIAGNTNAGIRKARGEYISFVDHDDVIEPDLLLEYVVYINEHPDVGLLYCDEDSFDSVDGRHFSPFFKPDLNVDFLLAHNYIVHCLTMRADLIEQVGLSDDGASGAQDYDLTLKAMEQGAEFGHIPRVLYHWRKHPGSTNGGADGAKPYAEKACIYVLDRYFDRQGINASVSTTEIPYVFRIDYGCNGVGGLMVVSYSDADTLECFLKSFYECEDSDSFDILAAGPRLEGSRKDGISRLAKRLDFIHPSDDGGACWDAVNHAVGLSEHQVVFLCNAGIGWRGKDSLQILGSYAVQPDIGVAFPKGFSQDGLTSGCGMCISDGTLVPINLGFTDGMGGGYLGFGEIASDYSAASPGCIVCRKEVFVCAGGLQGPLFSDPAACANFCFRVRESGLRIVFVPSVSIWNPVMDEVLADVVGGCLPGDQRRLYGKHSLSWRQDALYNPNMNVTSGYFRLNTEELMASEPSFVRRAMRRIRRLLPKH